MLYLYVFIMTEVKEEETVTLGESGVGEGRDIRGARGKG